MNIRFLETALYLANCKSFRVTAERLHITQAAISSRIAVLEEEFGARLFERDTKNVHLTPAGERFVMAAGEVLASYQQLKRVMQKDVGLHGLLRIGAVSSMAYLVLPNLISRIHVLYPAVTVDIVSDDTGSSFQERLSLGSVDFCLTALRETVLPGIEVQELCTLSMAWFASELTVPRTDHMFSPLDLSRYPVITYAQGSLNGERVKAYFEDTDIEHQRFLIADSLAALVRMATQGLGLAVLPECLVEREIAAGALYKLQIATPFPPTKYCTMYSQLTERSDVSMLHKLSVESIAKLIENQNGISSC